MAAKGQSRNCVLPCRVIDHLPVLSNAHGITIILVRIWFCCDGCVGENQVLTRMSRCGVVRESEGCGSAKLKSEPCQSGLRFFRQKCEMPGSEEPSCHSSIPLSCFRLPEKAA